MTDTRQGLTGRPAPRPVPTASPLPPPPARAQGERAADRAPRVLSWLQRVHATGREDLWRGDGLAALIVIGLALLAGLVSQIAADLPRLELLVVCLAGLPGAYSLVCAVRVALPRGLDPDDLDGRRPGSWPHSLHKTTSMLINAYDEALDHEAEDTAADVQTIAGIAERKFALVRRAVRWLIVTVGVLVAALLVGIVRLVVLLLT
ncbi:hypothetical protein [Saccharothrix sp. Mg75]|uniref:hypothetical protein n=1 Tax=Saccharothrix sp. Mg75 TaxID=3445357 RepID=UPI003EEB1940